MEREELEFDNHSEYLSHMSHNMQKIQDAAQQRIEISQANQKRNYDKTRKDRVLKTGDKVLLLVEPYRTKFGNRYEGPYEIIQQLGQVNYRIRLLNGVKTRVVHVNKLRYFWT